MITSTKVSFFNKYGLCLVFWHLSIYVFAQLASASQTQRSLVKIQTIFGDCNGVLLHIPDQSNRQLVLTARHCFDDNFALGRFLFGGDAWPQDTRIKQTLWSTTEFELLAESKDLDYALFELHESIPQALLPYAAGWNANSANPIHTYGFTSVDDVVISYEDLDSPDLRTINAIDDFGGSPVPNGGWWIKSWENGFTTLGSSGAALFNQWSRVVGILSAGASTPSAPFNDFFSRIDLIYQDTPVSSVLNPSSSNLESVNGREFFALEKLTNYSSQSLLLGDVEAPEISEFFNLPANSVIQGLYLPILSIDPADGLIIRILQDEDLVFEHQVPSSEIIEGNENFVAFTSSVTLTGRVEVQVRNQGVVIFPLLSGASSTSIQNTVLPDQSIGLGLLVEASEIEPKVAAFDLYPNPAKNNFFVEGASESDIFQFYDLQGKEVFPRKTTDYKNRCVFNTDAFADGPYLVVLPSGEVLRLFIDK